MYFMERKLIITYNIGIYIYIYIKREIIYIGYTHTHTELYVLANLKYI